MQIPFTVSGSASGGGTDYTVTASPITIAAGDTSQSITITLNDDALDESSETIIVTMGAPTNATLGTTTEHTVTITDNDETPAVAFTSSSQTAAEDAGSITVTAQLSVVSGVDVTVPFTVSGSATGGGTDYTVSASPITIAAGETTQTITITFVEDDLEEDEETLVIAMDSPTNAVPGTTAEHTITITDNDEPEDPAASLDDDTDGDDTLAVESTDDDGHCFIGATVK